MCHMFSYFLCSTTSRLGLGWLVHVPFASAFGLRLLVHLVSVDLVSVELF